MFVNVLVVAYMMHDLKNSDRSLSQQRYSEQQLSSYFKENIPQGWDFIDVAYNKYLTLFNDGNIGDSDKQLLLSSF